MPAQWLTRMSAFLESQNVFAPFEKIDADTAAETIVAAQPEDLSAIGFSEQDARRLGVKQGDVVSVTPKDTGTQLRSLSVSGKRVSTERAHVRPYTNYWQTTSS